MANEVSEVFYIKTKDKTTFAIYDLTLSDDCDTMSYGYNFIEDSNLDKEHYAEEVDMIVKTQVQKALAVAVADAEKEINT
jgi:hypothetical protein